MIQLIENTYQDYVSFPAGGDGGQIRHQIISGKSAGWVFSRRSQSLGGDGKRGVGGGWGGGRVGRVKNGGFGGWVWGVGFGPQKPPPGTHPTHPLIKDISPKKSRPKLMHEYGHVPAKMAIFGVLLGYPKKGSFLAIFGVFGGFWPKWPK